MSETFTTNQATIVASKWKKITWLFEVHDLYGNVFCWSTKNVRYGNVSLTGVDRSELEGQTAPTTSVPRFRSYVGIYSKTAEGAEMLYKHKVIEFDGVEMIRSKQDMNIIAPNDLKFTVSNADGSLVPANFNGGQVYLALLISNGAMERIIRRWRFKIKQVENQYKNFRVICEDWVQEYLRGLYPNTRLVRDIFSSSDVGANDSVCVPVPFGTAYVPIRSVYIGSTVSLVTANVKAVATASGERCYIQGTDRVNFKASGFETGRYVTISGFANGANNGTFYLHFVTASRLELSESAGLVDETAPGNITLTEGSRHYILGDPAYTYAISEVRSPRAWGRKSVWDNPVNSKHAAWGGTTAWDSTNRWNYQYMFSQSTKSDGVTNWRVFQPLIADVDLDGTGDSCGVWRAGEIFLDMPCKFTRSDTSTKTNPADVISWVLRDMGIENKNLGQATFDAAKATYAGWSLTWNGALWHKERRATILSRLLAMCASQLLIGEGVELHVLSKASQKTITTAEIMRRGYTGQGTFDYSDISHQYLHDSAYVGWQESGESQDLMVKTLVPATGTSKLVPASTVIDMPWVQNSQRVQRLATLYFQRALLKKAQVSFVAKSTCLALNPGDVITMSGALYGAGTTYDAIIDNMKINKDCSIQISATRLSCDIDDYGDLSPSAITLNDDDTSKQWEQSLGGPMTDEDLTRGTFEVMGKPYLVVGKNTNFAQFTDIQKAVNALSESRHVGVYICNGSYYLTAPIYMYGGRNVDIIGESMDGVKLHGATSGGSNGNIFLVNGAATFRFNNFSIIGRNPVSNVSNGIYVHTTNPRALYFDGIKFEMNDSRDTANYGATPTAYSDTAITIAKDPMETLSIMNCFFSKGQGIALSYVTSFSIANNAFDDITLPVYTYSCSGGVISANKISNLRGTGFSIDENSSEITISANSIACGWSTEKMVQGYSSPMYLDGDYITVVGNSLNIYTHFSYVHGIWYVSHATHHSTSNNMIYLSTDYYGGSIWGIYDDSSSDSVISGNRITMINVTPGPAPSSGYGIYCLNTARAIANNNVIEGTGSAFVSDTGIHLDTNTAWITGSDNVTYNVSDALNNLGTNNSVAEPKDS